MFAIISLSVRSCDQMIAPSNYWEKTDTNILIQDIDTLKIERVGYNKVLKRIQANEPRLGGVYVRSDGTINISQHYDLRFIKHNFNTSLVRHRYDSPWLQIRGREYRFEFDLGRLRDRVRGTEIAKFSDRFTVTPAYCGFLYFHTLSDYIVGHYCTSNGPLRTLNDVYSMLVITMVFDKKGMLCDVFADPNKFTILFDGYDRHIQSKMKLLCVDY